MYFYVIITTFAALIEKLQNGIAGNPYFIMFGVSKLFYGCVIKNRDSG